MFFCSVLLYHYKYNNDQNTKGKTIITNKCTIISTKHMNKNKVPTTKL